MRKRAVARAAFTCNERRSPSSACWRGSRSRILACVMVTAVQKPIVSKRPHRRLPELPAWFSEAGHIDASCARSCRVRVGAATSLPDLRKGNEKPQIRVAVPIAAALVSAAAAQRNQYTQHMAAVVLLCATSQNSNACEHSMYRKSCANNERLRQQRADLLVRTHRAPLLLG